VLAAGGLLAAAATVWMGNHRHAGIALGVVAFALIGLGVSAAGTSLLVLLAKRVVPERRAASATIVWLMMILGFAVTAGVVGRLLDPYSPTRLLVIAATLAVGAVLVAMVALYGLEGAAPAVAAPEPDGGGEAAPKPRFREALAQVWDEPAARRFTVFVFLSMIAYSAQDLILEPFAGVVFGYTPGESTQLSGVQHGGVLVGMLMAAFAGSQFGGRQIGTLRGWTVGGCLASALALFGLVASGLIGPAWPFKATVFLLGMANGAFSIAAIGSMMRLASEGRASREGVRMGLWGAAQAIAFGLGGLGGAVASDLARWLIGSQGAAYATVFFAEGLLFLVAAALASRIGRPDTAAPEVSRALRPSVGDRLVARMEAR
ncbi:MAG: BCD family MFS transporter, partial [Ideonella sp.]|nr:BCD family MFS transporter [Ideonella sp.]